MGSGSGSVITFVGGEELLLRKRSSLKVVTFGADPGEGPEEVSLFGISMRDFLFSCGGSRGGASPSGVNAMSQSKRSGCSELAGKVLTLRDGKEGGTGGKGRGGGGGGGESGNSVG